MRSIRTLKWLNLMVAIALAAFVAGCGDDGNGTEDVCDPNPCTAAHQSICAPDGADGYLCLCDQGYAEVNGECVLYTQDNCDPNPCTEANRGLCVDDGDSYLCLCNEGYHDVDGTCVPYGQGYECEGDVCILTGSIVQDLTLTADKDWLLRGGVFIGDDVNETVLTVEAGTTVYGETSTNGMLVVTRGSKIMAEGTAAAPIVFTSSKAPGTRARGDWGGVIINGKSTTNNCSEDPKNPGQCEAFGEGGTGWYGGTDEADDSGVLKYVRIEFAGRIISPDNELNGLALQAVGSGTTLEYIQVHMNKDDGVEFFGGTANFKYILTTGIADDNLDWTDGWRGKGQFFVCQQYEDAGDQGIEADNNGEDNTATPRSHPTISNITLIGSPDSEKSDIGMLLREGTAANIHNAVVVGFNDAGLDVDHRETHENAHDGSNLTGELTVENSIVSCASPFKNDDDSVKDDNDQVIWADTFTEEEFYNLNTGNSTDDPLLGDPFNLTAPDYTPGAGSPALTGAVVPGDSFFDQVTFKGGVDPVNDWTAGWTTHEPN